MILQVGVNLAINSPERY